MVIYVVPLYKKPYSWAFACPLPRIGATAACASTLVGYLTGPAPSFKSPARRREAGLDRPPTSSDERVPFTHSSAWCHVACSHRRAARRASYLTSGWSMATGSHVAICVPANTGAPHGFQVGAGPNLIGIPSLEIHGRREQVGPTAWRRDEGRAISVGRVQIRRRIGRAE
jgi:hypothetical protein